MLALFTTFILFLLTVRTRAVSLDKRDTITFTSPTENAEYRINSNISVSFDFRRNGMVYFTFPMTTYLHNVATNSSVLVSNISEPLVGTHQFVVVAPSETGAYRFEVFTPTWYNHLTDSGMNREIIESNKVAEVSFTVHDTETHVPEREHSDDHSTDLPNSTITETTSSPTSEPTEIHSKISPTPTAGLTGLPTSGCNRNVVPNKTMLGAILVSSVLAVFFI